MKDSMKIWKDKTLGWITRNGLVMQLGLWWGSSGGLFVVFVWRKSGPVMLSFSFFFGCFQTSLDDVQMLPTDGEEEMATRRPAGYGRDGMKI